MGLITKRHLQYVSIHLKFFTYKFFRHFIQKQSEKHPFMNLIYLIL